MGCGRDSTLCVYHTRIHSSLYIRNFHLVRKDGKEARKQPLVEGCCKEAKPPIHKASFQA